MRHSLSPLILAMVTVFGSVAILFFGGSIQRSQQVPEMVLASARGTNNQNPLLKDNNGNTLGYNCAGMNYPAGYDATAYCTAATENQECVSCPDNQTWAATIDNSKTTPTGGWAASGQITCTGTINIGGVCVNGFCTGGDKTTVKCSKPVQQYIQQQTPPGN